ncbi:Glu/Leu/Phe/Val dehydrogenase [Sporolactobacillus kofuensis]|uniref:Glutamate dehydrogenase n=1 Tax=Sporolactobacillus kofuensis TaxID=269672 RepID=A0ABW1WEE4_9BACL|nr:Glu/Leu/Phe/Val dehydrogenase [Sporolactobacillus kofuensis]MCO7176616.1 Glu/Leu/Phe/Val dehydrogenase [Sporolactobacillus kofuensis]
MQMKQALKELGFSEDVYQLLSEPQRSLSVRIPVKMDSGHVRVFTGYRVQHSFSIGPTKGGVLFHPEVTETQMESLSIMNSLKNGLLSIPFGGAKGGVICEPRELSFRELELLSRGYIQAISSVIGPYQDIPAPDIFTNSQIMAWMMDEYSKLCPDQSAGFITGKPIVLGGLKSRKNAAGRGIVLFISEAARKLGIELTEATAIVQGFGSLGGYVAKSLADSGVTITGLSDAYGAVYQEQGLDMDSLIECRDSFGTITKMYKHTLTSKELMEKSADIMVLAAVSDPITEQNVRSMKSKLVIEASSGAVTDQAAEWITNNGILFVPEILTSSGDITSSYIEWAQNRQGLIWSKEEGEMRVKQILADAFSSVHEIAEERKIPMKKAAYIAGVYKMAESARFRGWF